MGAVSSFMIGPSVMPPGQLLFLACRMAALTHARPLLVSPGTCGYNRGRRFDLPPRPFLPVKLHPEHSAPMPPGKPVWNDDAVPSFFTFWSRREAVTIIQEALLITEMGNQRRAPLLAL